MAIPKYKRNSSGFFAPEGQTMEGLSTNTGPVSGQAFSREQRESLVEYGKRLGLDDLDARAIAFGDRNPGAYAKVKESRKKALETAKKAQARHDKIMADINTKEASTFKRINDALTASREVDAKNKDNLGRPTPPSKQTTYLEQQLDIILMNRGKNTAPIVPGGKGTDPRDYDAGGRLQTETVAEGKIPMQPMDTRPEQRTGPPFQPSIPAGRGPEDVEPGSSYADILGASNLLNRTPGQGPPPKTMEYIPPKPGDRAEAMINGERQQVEVMQIFGTPQGQAVKIKLRDGSFVAIPLHELNRIDLSDPLPGDAPPDPGGQRKGFFQHEGRRAASMDVLTGL